MKSIAERFIDEFITHHYGNRDKDLFLRWLEQQPENTKTFTIDEVDKLVEWAFAKGIIYKGIGQQDRFLEQWANKKQELMK